MPRLAKRAAAVAAAAAPAALASAAAAATQTPLEHLAQRLREASHAYYETGTPIMTDAEFDNLVDQLRELDPTHPFLRQVGAPPGGSVVQLPVPMPSLDKRKPDTLRAVDLTGPALVSQKLDGISALWVCGYSTKAGLYLRGNGLEGQDVSHCIGNGKINGLTKVSIPHTIVRGELIVSKKKGLPNARNWVNGVLHQKDPRVEDLAQIDFVAYELCFPRLPRSQQMFWLKQRGFQVVWHERKDTLTREWLEEAFMTTRNAADYECDGLVVGLAEMTPAQSAENPGDAYAFKMPVDDQRAETVVEAVEWASSRTGNWIPRIRFQPVVIGNATIEYCTGFHGQFIFTHGIGPGARIIVRRSGDVIPVCERVASPAPAGWQSPPEGVWEWDVAGVHLRDVSTVKSAEKLALEMAHQLVALDVEGVSKVTCKKLVEGDIVSLHDVYKASVARLQQLIGQVNGEKLSVGLKTAVGAASTAKWVRAFLGWPKGFGESRIEAALEKEPNVEAWRTVDGPPRGQSAEAFAEVVKCVDAYVAWRGQFPVASLASTNPIVSVNTKVPEKGTFGMSGFRDADLQARLGASGWKFVDSVSHTTKFLLVPDDAKETTKVKAARSAGVQIVLRSQASSLF
jgi:NAD-dependent DNA ligase